MSKTLLNPFELLGITEKSTLKDARKSYYKLAMLCHPDCGGHEESMKVLVNAYSFVEQQLKNKQEISGDWTDLGKNLEEEFKKFNLEVKAEVPQLRDLYDIATEEDKKDIKERNFGAYNNLFNEEFENESKYQFEELVADNPFANGYGELMDNDHDHHSDDEYVMPTKNKFTQEIQIYKEPHVLPDTYGNNFRYDVSEVNDYSNYDNKEFDYKKAHTESLNPPQEIESERDLPINNLEIAVEELKMKRDKLMVDKSQIDLVLKK